MGNEKVETIHLLSDPAEGANLASASGVAHPISRFNILTCDDCRASMVPLIAAGLGPQALLLPPLETTSWMDRNFHGT
jgi:hypothetical protein